MTERPDGASGGGLALVIGMIVMACVGAVVATVASRRDDDRPDEVFDKQAPATLVRELEDPTERTRAGFKLLDQGQEAVPALLRAAQDPDFKARARAIDLLGQLRAPEAVPLLLKLNDPALAEVRVVALGRIQGAEALAAIRKVLKDPQAPVPVTFAAVRAAAGWQDPPQDLDADVEPYLHHDVWGLREFAAAYFGAHKRVEAVPALIGLLKDSNASVRRKAAWALMQIKAPAGVKAVDEALAAGAIPPDQD